MITNTNTILGAVAYSLTKKPEDPLFNAIQEQEKLRYAKLASTFFSLIGGGPLARHSAEGLGKALVNLVPDLGLTDEQGATIATTYLNVAATVTDNVY